MSAIKWAKLLPHDKERLLYLIAKWHITEKKPLGQIVNKVKDWVKENARDCYDENGRLPDPTTIGRYFVEAVKRGFVKLGCFSDHHLVDSIIDKFDLQFAKVKIVVAPDRDEMLRYVWLDLDRLLTKMIVTKKRDKVVVGVSGGHTMLDLSNMARILTDLTWHYEVSEGQRERVVVCSLTSGGIRSDIAALSDTVAATIADYLGAQTSGLLGPAWFADKSALDAFRRDPDVQNHIDLVKGADIILTSVGYLGGSKESKESKVLMRQLLDRAKESKFVKDNPYLADMLYHCYHGLSGRPIKLPQKVTDGLFSVVDLEQLRKMDSLCFVLAAGEEKGLHALPGILKMEIASHVYMDRPCAEGLIKAKTTD